MFTGPAEWYTASGVGAQGLSVVFGLPPCVFISLPCSIALVFNSKVGFKRKSANTVEIRRVVLIINTNILINRESFPRTSRCIAGDI